MNIMLLVVAVQDLLRLKSVLASLELALERSGAFMDRQMVA
jgi:hypothetical protein